MKNIKMKLIPALLSSITLGTVVATTVVSCKEAERITLTQSVDANSVVLYNQASRNSDSTSTIEDTVEDEIRTEVVDEVIDLVFSGTKFDEQLKKQIYELIENKKIEQFQYVNVEIKLKDNHFVKASLKIDIATKRAFASTDLIGAATSDIANKMWDKVSKVHVTLTSLKVSRVDADGKIVEKELSITKIDESDTTSTIKVKNKIKKVAHFIRSYIRFSLIAAIVKKDAPTVDELLAKFADKKEVFKQIVNKAVSVKDKLN